MKTVQRWQFFLYPLTTAFFAIIYSKLIFTYSLEKGSAFYSEALLLPRLFTVTPNCWKHEKKHLLFKILKLEIFFYEFLIFLLLFNFLSTLTFLSILLVVQFLFIPLLWIDQVKIIKVSNQTHTYKEIR